MAANLRDSVTCPACNEGLGVAMAVEAGRGHTIVTYRCDQCAHQWSIERDDPDVPLRAELKPPRK